jgi:quinol-cytochrome oxidoreductase complex cytochrome b subunit
VIVLIRSEADAAAVRELLDSVTGMGLEVLPLDDGKGRGFEVIGGERGRVLALRDLPAVEEILTRRTVLEGGEPLWPHFALRVAILFVSLLVVLALLSAFVPPGLGDQALGDSLTPPPASVEWYLRPLAGFLGLFGDTPSAIGGALLLLCWLAFTFWPFVDRADASTAAGARMAKLARVLGAVVCLLVVLLAIRGGR